MHEIRLAVQMLCSFQEPVVPIKIAVLGSYTTELLRDYWTFHGLLHGFEFDLYLAPYGQVIQELHDRSDLFKQAPDFAYLLLQWSDIVPGLAEPIHALDGCERNSLIHHCVSGLREMLVAARKVLSGSIVVSFLPCHGPLGLGLHDVMAESSETSFRLKLKRSVSELLLEEFPSVFFDDGDDLLTTLGYAGAFDRRLWHTGRFPFSVEGANLFVHRLVRFPVLCCSPRVKCIVLDCDGTLWGGIIGEDGMEGIALGPDYPGSCYVAFQRRLLDFVHRGYLLAICSKNNLTDVQQVIREHPHMVLREDRFAAVRANWEPKHDNVRSIAQELRLGLESFLFVDDSPYERRMLGRLMPEVRIAEVPREALDVPTCLDHLQELEIVSFTAEDRDRSRMYTQNRRRLEASVASHSVEEFLMSLQMRMRICIGGGSVPRLAQMTQKTNQFNLTTKRYTQEDIQTFIEDPGWLVAYFSLSDIYGDSGIVGLTLLSGMTTDKVEVDAFLISCRVIGRQAEAAFLHQVLMALRDLGKATVRARYVPTAKNALARDFLAQQGFLRVGEGVYELSLATVSEKHPSLGYFAIQLEGKD